MNRRQVRGGGGPYDGGTTKFDTWEIYLVGVGEIDHARNRAKMLHLASEISKFIGRELVDNSAKPGDRLSRDWKL